MMTIFLDYWVALKRAFWVDGIEAPVALWMGRKISVCADMVGISTLVWRLRGRRGLTCDALYQQEEEEARNGREGQRGRGRT